MQNHDSEARHEIRHRRCLLLHSCTWAPPITCTNCLWRSTCTCTWALPDSCVCIDATSLICDLHSLLWSYCRSCLTCLVCKAVLFYASPPKNPHILAFHHRCCYMSSKEISSPLMSAGTSLCSQLLVNCQTAIVLRLFCQDVTNVWDVCLVVSGQCEERARMLASALSGPLAHNMQRMKRRCGAWRASCASLTTSWLKTRKRLGWSSGGNVSGMGAAISCNKHDASQISAFVIKLCSPFLGPEHVC